MTQMWFGNRWNMRWIDAPMSGADITPVGSTEAGVLANGGGFVAPSYGSHRRWQYSWGGAASPQFAAYLQGLYNGAYGRRPIYFLDPMWYNVNILPPAWANPGMMEDASMPPLQQINPLPVTFFDTAADLRQRWNIPERGARFRFSDYGDWTGLGDGTDRRDSVFIPIPPGYKLVLGAVYNATPGAGIYCQQIVGPTSAIGDVYTLTPVTAGGLSLHPNTLIPEDDSVIGVELWIGKDEPDGLPSNVNLSAMSARLIPLETSDYWREVQTPTRDGPWYPGQGHTGARMEGPPTVIANNGVGGGQLEVAATFREVGPWEF